MKGKNFKENNPKSLEKANHPIWPGLDRGKAINTQIPEHVYETIAIASEKRSTRRLPTWIKRASEHLIDEIFRLIKLEKSMPEMKIIGSQTKTKGKFTTITIVMEKVD